MLGSALIWKKRDSETKQGTYTHTNSTQTQTWKLKYTNKRPIKENKKTKIKPYKVKSLQKYP